jgi:OTU domain-containing protein 6
LYAALADQLNLHGHKGLTYQDTRKVTSNFMKSHADEFMPFISDSDEHMAGIENTEAGSPNNSDMSKQQRESLPRSVRAIRSDFHHCRPLLEVL